jgi:hypothetical protein
VLQWYIHALADLFVNVKKYQQVFLVPLPRNNCFFAIFKTSLAVYPFFLSFSFFYPYTMENLFIHQLSALEDEFLEPSLSPKPITSFGYELHPGIVAMVRGQTFSGLEDEDPHRHLQEFEELCSCLVVLGMAKETLRWKLFPFSLMEKVEQWYTHNVRSVNGD